MSRKRSTDTKTPAVAIIGYGFGGIAAAVRLKKSGIEHFTIFEKSEGIGGTADTPGRK